MPSIASVGGTRIAVATLLAAAAIFGGYAIVRAATQSGSNTPLARDFAASVSQSTSPEQAASLADGSVSLAEYNAAVERTAQCANVQVVKGSDKQPFTITFSAPTLAVADAIKARLDECEALYLKDIDTTWALQWAQDTDAQQAAHQRLTECIEAQGLQVSGGFLSVDDLNALLVKAGKMTHDERILFDTYRRCAVTVREKSGYPLP